MLWSFDAATEIQLWHDESHHVTAEIYSPVSDCIMFVGAVKVTETWLLSCLWLFLACTHQSKPRWWNLSYLLTQLWATAIYDCFRTNKVNESQKLCCRLVQLANLLHHMTLKIHCVLHNVNIITSLMCKVFLNSYISYI